MFFDALDDLFALGFRGFEEHIDLFLFLHLALPFIDGKPFRKDIGTSNKVLGKQYFRQSLSGLLGRKGGINRYQFIGRAGHRPES